MSRRQLGECASIVQTWARFHGLAVAVACGGAALNSKAAPPGAGHGFHVPMPNQELYLECRVPVGDIVQVVETNLTLPTTMAPATLDQQITLPAPFGPVRVLQYLPQAKRSQGVVADPAGHPALHLAIVGRKQSFDRWLVADDPAHNRLTSILGTWRYHAVATAGDRDALYRQFEQELTRPATILVSSDDAPTPRRMPATEGSTQAFANVGCTLRVLRFFPHFGYDQSTQEPVNQSDRRFNPAALVRIEHSGAPEERWVFGKFPDYKAGEGPAAKYHVALDCPVETQNAAPDFVVVTVGADGHEVWTRHEGRVHSARLTLDSPVRIPGANYTFAMTRFVVQGRLVETYASAEEKRDAATVLRVAVSGAADHDAPVWLELGKARVVPTEDGPVTLIFATRTPQVHGGGS